MCILDWLLFIIYREETGDHRHCDQGYMACIRNISGLSPKAWSPRPCWEQGEIMSHKLVVLQNKQCKRLCVDWICPPNKSSVFYSLLYVLLAAKLLLYGHQGSPILKRGTENGTERNGKRNESFEGKQNTYVYEFRWYSCLQRKTICNKIKPWILIRS